MKNLIKIIFILALVAAFSSCSKTETDGFEDAEVVLKGKLDNPSSIGQMAVEKDNKSGVRTKGLLEDEDLDSDSITDDDDDDEEGANKVSE